MYQPEVWAMLVAAFGLALHVVLGVPLAWTLAIGAGLALAVSTCVLGVRYSMDKRLSDRIKNATEDDIRLPEGFLFGAATAAHQVEGNQHNDWTEWEQARNWEPSGNACDAWNLFPHDVERMRWLGLDCFRFSVEWSRIEPQPGVWMDEPLERYASWCRLLRQNSIEPIVTLHHFSSPTWLVGAGGFENASVVEHFVEFARRVTEALKPYVRYFVTFNEPALYALNSCVTNERPGDRRYTRPGDLAAMCRLMRNLVNAHAEAYHAMHLVHPECRVSVAKNIIHYEPRAKWSPLDLFICQEIDRVYNHAMLDALTTGTYSVSFGSRLFMRPIHEKNPKWANTLDYLGVNHYNISTVGFDLSQPQLIAVDSRRVATENVKNQMGWECEPASMLLALRKMSRYGLPVLITEAGCCDDGVEMDHRRQQFMLQNLACVTRALEEQITVVGFCVWSLVSNIEWDSGRVPRFGLFDIDYATVDRQHRERAWESPNFVDRSRLTTGSAKLYKRIIANHRHLDVVSVAGSVAGSVASFVAQPLAPPPRGTAHPSIAENGSDNEIEFDETEINETETNEIELGGG